MEDGEGGRSEINVCLSIAFTAISLFTVVWNPPATKHGLQAALLNIEDLILFSVL